MAVVSFSITKHDTESSRCVERVKSICIRNGLNFSYVVLEALKMYEDENLNKRKDLR